MGICAKCGRYFSLTKQKTAFCPECERSNMSQISSCDTPIPHSFGEQKGWICPVCGRGVAPWVDVCPCQSDVCPCQSIENIASGTGARTVDEELDRLFELNHERVAEMIRFQEEFKK